MQLRLNLMLLVFCFSLASCTSGSNKAKNATATPELIEEIQTLDSLNQLIEKNTTEIESGIKSLETTLNDLLDFE